MSARGAGRAGTVAGGRTAPARPSAAPGRRAHIRARSRSGRRSPSCAGCAAALERRPSTCPARSAEAAGALPRDVRDALDRAAAPARTATTRRTSGASTRSSPTALRPFLELPLRPLVAGRGRGRAQRARARPRAARGQPRRHPALGRDDDVGRDPCASTRCRATRASSCSTGRSTCPGCRSPCASSAAWSPRPTTRCACSSRTSSWRCSPRARRAPARPSAERYRLQRFGRGGFVEIALRTGAPIVPVAVVGSEEIYPKLGEPRAARAADRRALLPDHARPSRCSARSALVPLPSKWRIEFCEPIDTAQLRARGGRGPQRSCSSCPSRCATTIQQKVYENLVRRGSAFI